MPAYLDTIVAAHRAAVADDRRHLDEVLDQVGRAGAVRPFQDAIAEAASLRGMAVISEIKRRSPSKGDLDPTLDPETVAKEYEAGGAACLSVLTDADFFGGTADDVGHGPGRLLAPGPAQGLHRQPARRVRCPADGRRRRAAHRGRPQ